jgi:hypothetical protein
MALWEIKMVRAKKAKPQEEIVEEKQKEEIQPELQEEDNVPNPLRSRKHGSN